MEWSKELDAAITVCDIEGKIIYLNEKAAEVFKDDGGYKLLGQNLFDCHSSQSNDKIKQIISERKPNTYTIEKAGKKKLIHQTPWYENGDMKGLVEFSIEIPYEMPNFIRS